MKILNNFLNFIKNNKKNTYFLVFLGIFCISYDITLAEDSNALAFNEIIGWIVILIGILTQGVGYFLSPEWTSGLDMGLLPKLKTLWILVSNVVYFIFALMFVGLAFMNIIGKSDDYAFKTAIPRFIVGVIMVPLSWFIVQFVVSLSSILTASVLALPFDLFSDYKDKIGSAKICTHIVVMKNEVAATTAPAASATPAAGATPTTTSGDKTTKTTISCDPTNGKTDFKEFLGNMNMFGILNYYTYGIMKADTIVSVDGNTTTIFKDLFSLIGKIGFDFIFLILYLFLLLILGVSLLIRGIMLWLFMVLSPLFGLLYFIKKDPKGLEGFTFQEFVSLAMVPVYVSAALSFGLLFIFVAGSSLENNTQKTQLSITKQGSGVLISAGNSTDENKRYKVTTNMLPGDKLVGASGAASETAEKSNGAVDLFLKIFGLGILWFAIVTALSSSKITTVAAQPLKDIGGQAMDVVKKAPSSIPIIPTSQGMMSTNNLSQAARTISSNIQSIGQQDAQNLGNTVSEKLGIKGNEVVQAIERSIPKIKLYGTSKVSGDIDKGINELLSKIDAKDLQSTQVRAALSRGFEALGMKPEDIKNLESKVGIEAYSLALHEIINKNNMALNPVNFTQNEIREKINKPNGNPETPVTRSSALKQEGSNIKIIIGTANDGSENSTTYLMDGNKIKNDNLLDEFGKKLYEAKETGTEEEIKKKLDAAGIKDDGQKNKIYAAYKKAKEEAEKAKNPNP